MWNDRYVLQRFNLPENVINTGPELGAYIMEIQGAHILKQRFNFPDLKQWNFMLRLDLNVSSVESMQLIGYADMFITGSAQV